MFINRSDKAVYIEAIKLFLVSGGASLLFSKLWGVSDRSEGNALFQLVSLLIYGHAAYVVALRNTKLGVSLLIRSFPLVFLISVCFVSVAWSVEPFPSFRRSVALVLSFIYCLYLISEYDSDQILSIVFYSLLLIGVLGILAVGIPGWGIGTEKLAHENAVRGLTGHKNEFGRYMGVATLVTIMYFKSYKNLYFLASISFFFGALVLSQSKTPLAVLLTVCILIPGVRLIVEGRFFKGSQVVLSATLRWIIVLSFLIVAVTVTFATIEFVVVALGKDLTFSGRTSIWQYALEIGKERMLLGAGYRTFWTDTLTWDFRLYNPYWESDGIIGNGHNGFIDVYLETGLLGFGAYLAFLISYIYRCVRSKGSSGRNEIVAFSLLVFYLLYSITEQVTLEQSELLWMLLMVFYILIGQRNSYAK